MVIMKLYALPPMCNHKFDSDLSWVKLLAGHQDPPSGATPTTGLNPGGELEVQNNFHTTNDSAEDESQDRDDYFETVYTACLTLNASEVNNDISEWAQKINELQEGLLGSDSFLMTAQSQVDTILANPTGLIDQQIANLTKDTALKNAKSLAGLVQEIRRWVLRKTTGTLINNASGFAPLSTRYIANLAKNQTLDTISCLFIKILQNLEGLIGNALGALANRIINGATCLVENFIGNIIRTNHFSDYKFSQCSIRIPISNLLGSVIGFTSEILEFAKSILNFLECDIENICSKIKRYNPLNGFQRQIQLHLILVGYLILQKEFLIVSKDLLTFLKILVIMISLLILEVLLRIRLIIVTLDSHNLVDPTKCCFLGRQWFWC